MNVNLAEVVAEDRTRFRRRKHLDVDVFAPAGGDLEQVPVTSGQSARPS
jgi:hypothetical protein